MNIHQQLANATIQIESGDSWGSGFHFMDQHYAITNYHVVKPSIVNSNIPVFGITEDGRKYEFDIIDYSDDNNRDFVLLQCKTDIEPDRVVLLPKFLNPLERGTEVLFAGFPHGVPHLLVNRGIVSGYRSNHSFYLDGIVNGGNSGGPIIDPTDFTVIGIVTQRRFFGGRNLDAMSNEAHQLMERVNRMRQGITVQFGSVDLGSFMDTVGRSIELSTQAIQLNSNTGIGIGFTIDAAQKCYINHI